MEEKRMIKVTVDGAEYAYPQGTPYRTIAADFQDRYPCDILLVNRDGKLCELHKVLDRDCALRMVTAQDKPGIQTYERSAVFLMLKAFYDVAGRENVERVSVEYSLSSAIFILAKGGFTLDQALLDRVEARMRELSAAAKPIEKQSISTDDAVELFRQAGLVHKAQLLSFRINSRVNVYSLDGFVDYFYGYMVPDTSYIRCFGLELFENGFVLRLPTQQDPNRLGDFRPSHKVFRELSQSTLRSQALSASNVAELNTAIAQGGATPLILAHEAMMEKKIGDIAAEIAGRKEVRFVMIAGPSSSGKTTFSHRLCTQLRACGLRPYPIATDNYFVNRDKTPGTRTATTTSRAWGPWTWNSSTRTWSGCWAARRWSCPPSTLKRGCGSITATSSPWGRGTCWLLRASTVSTTSLPTPCRSRASTRSISAA